jgi:hypothetical protein
MSMWGTITWDVARAGGFTAYLLLTASVAIGLALTLHYGQSPRWPRIINSEMHNYITLLSLIFTGVHILAVWLDPFTRFGLAEVFVPFVSHYRPLWMALGIVALYLGLAIGLSTWLRPLIGYAWWRRLHVLTLVSYLLVTAHGIATGSDTRTWWGVLLYAGSAGLIALLWLLRLLTPTTAQIRRHPLWAGLTIVLLAAGAIWTLLGPLQPGWNAIANNGQGSGARVALAAGNGSSGNGSNSNGTGTSTSGPLGVPFTAPLQGTLTQTGPDASGTVTYHLTATFQSGTTGTVDVQMMGQADNAGGDDGGSVTITSTAVTLGTTSSPALYQGQVSDIRAFDNRWHMTAVLAPQRNVGGSQIVVQLSLILDTNSNAVQGTIRAAATGGSSGGSAGGGSNSTGSGL